MGDGDGRKYHFGFVNCFLETLKQLPDEEKVESTELFMVLVDKVIVGDGLTFILRDGSEEKINGVR